MVNVPPNQWLLQIFHTFEVFRTFDDFLTDLPLSLPASTPSYSTTIWTPLVDVSADELILSIEVSGTAILLNHWLKRQ